MQISKPTVLAAIAIASLTPLLHHAPIPARAGLGVTAWAAAAMLAGGLLLGVRDA